MKVSVDWGLCDSQGVCTVNCPEVFELDENDDLQVLTEHPPAELHEKVEAAARKCPKGAISLS